MKNWTPVWHQALTGSLNNGRPCGKDNTIVLPLHIPVSASGIRMRFNNLFGSTAYPIGAVTVKTAEGIYPVTVEGKQSFEITCGSRIFTDNIAVNIPKGSDIEIRIFYAGYINDMNMIEEGAQWLKGNQTAAKTIPGRIRKPLPVRILGAYNPVPSIDLVEIETEEETKQIVAFGDSITALSKWTKPLSSKLEKEYDGKCILLNSGIAGNCLLYEPEGMFSSVFGQKGIDRFERDVLELPHTDTVIFALGVNDVSYLNEKTKDIISYENYIRTVEEMTVELKKRNIRVIAQTITPRLKCARSMGVFTQEMEELRLSLNEWIRNCDLFDAVADQEKTVRDKDEHGFFFHEGLHMGDHLHPNEKGGRLMAETYLSCLKQLMND